MLRYDQAMIRYDQAVIRYDQATIRYDTGTFRYATRHEEPSASHRGLVLSRSRTSPVRSE